MIRKPAAIFFRSRIIPSPRANAGLPIAREHLRQEASGRIEATTGRYRTRTCDNQRVEFGVEVEMLSWERRPPACDARVHDGAHLASGGGSGTAFDFTYLSLGCGVQSTALLVLCEQGKVAPPDVAIFADTQDEPRWVYEHLQRLKAWASIPIHVTTFGKLSRDIEDRHNGKKKRFASLPAFTVGDDGRAALLRRQCTREYKIDPIHQAVRRLLGYKPRQRNRHKVRCLIGISWDEYPERCKPSRDAWVTNEWPLVDARITREKCKEIIAAAGLPIPGKSSCVFCPFHSDGFWFELKRNHPREFAEAVRVDRMIRDMTASGLKRPAFLHRSLTPLEMVNFEERTKDLFGSECDGYCGV